MKRLLIIISFFVLTSAIVKAQNVNFRSSVFESYVKKHVGIGETEKLNTTQLDTIQQIDLSGLDLIDISDVKFLTNVRGIDLSNNKIEDIASLATLDSLCEVNLSHNNLKSISRLSFSYARKMYVNVAFNDIKDFSCFNTLTNCCFTIAGVDMQYDKERSFYDVDYLVCNIRFDKPYVFCRVNSNIGTKALLTLNNEKTEVPTDRTQFEYEIKSDISSALPVYLTNGDYIDSTYIVPVSYSEVDGGNSITLKTGLPEDYVLSTANAQYGKVVIVGNTIEYTAPDKAVPDKIDYCYNHGATLKGISCFYINQDKGEKGDADGDGAIGSQDLKALVDAYIENRQVNKVTDIDEDGELTIVDITKLISVLSENKEPLNSHNGYEYVDLGLPSGTLWATCNIDATKPEEFGGYYAWGETMEKNVYDRQSYLYIRNKSDHNYIDLGRNISGTNYDVAREKRGGDWCMPTKNDFKELWDNCTHSWAMVNGVKGMTFTASNENSLFLPASGYKCDSDYGEVNENGYFRVSTSDTHYTFRLYTDEPDYFALVEPDFGDVFASDGLSVRPVLHPVSVPESSFFVSCSELDFDIVELGTDKTKSFKIFNTTDTDITFHVSCDAEMKRYFEVSDNEKEITLAPNTSKEYVVTSHGMPTSYEATTTLQIISNTGNHDVILKSYGWDYLIDKTQLTMKVGEKLTIPIKTDDYSMPINMYGSIYVTRGGGESISEGGDPAYSGHVHSSSGNLLIEALGEGTPMLQITDNLSGKTNYIWVTIIP